MSAVLPTSILDYKVIAGDLLFFHYETVPRVLRLMITNHTFVPYKFIGACNPNGSTNIEGYDLPTEELIAKHFGSRCPPDLKFVPTPLCAKNFSVWKASI